jgi:starch phosphorylase
MKAALNGVPSLSILDGWWIEGCIEGVTGWAIEDGANDAEEATSLYKKLETAVVPLYLDAPEKWARLMRTRWPSTAPTSTPTAWSSSTRATPTIP